MTLDEILAFRRAPEGNRILLFKLEDCPPCDLLEQALPSVRDLSDIPRSDFLVRFADKKAMGAVLKAGVTDFPFLELYRAGTRVLQARGVRGNSAGQVASNLSILMAPLLGEQAASN